MTIPIPEYRQLQPTKLSRPFNSNPSIPAEPWYHLLFEKQGQLHILSPLRPCEHHPSAGWVARRCFGADPQWIAIHFGCLSPIEEYTPDTRTHHNDNLYHMVCASVVPMRTTMWYKLSNQGNVRYIALVTFVASTDLYVRNNGLQRDVSRYPAGSPGSVARVHPTFSKKFQTFNLAWIKKKERKLRSQTHR